MYCYEIFPSTATMHLISIASHLKFAKNSKNLITIFFTCKSEFCWHTSEELSSGTRFHLSDPNLEHMVYANLCIYQINYQQGNQGPSGLHHCSQIKHGEVSCEPKNLKDIQPFE